MPSKPVAEALPTVDHETIAGRYQIEGMLGRGGMGSVYAAFDSVTKTRVALKILERKASREALELFQREYQTLVSLKHPKIVEVYEYGHARDTAYYTMELLSGADLSGSAPMPWREACACLRDVASVLDVLHMRGLVHRDLSPRNVWRLPDGRLKLLDFGALAPFGVALGIVGTPPFIPPEALRGEPLDARSDLFSLGALGYWLLTGGHAFRAKSIGELPRLWESEPVVPGALLRHSAAQDDALPPALDALILHLLRLEPDRRLSSTAELMERLSAIAELPADRSEQSAQGYLQSKAFVGRERERERLFEQLSAAEQGAPRALLIEGAAGVGRTRLLSEFAMLTRVAGALTVHVAGRTMKEPYALCRALLTQLTATLPDARAAAEEDAEILSQVCPGLGGATGPRPNTKHTSEDRVRLQVAIQEWLLATVSHRLVAVIVDDIHLVDEESLSVLSVVVRAEQGHKLLLVTSILREGSNELSPLAQSLRNVSSTVRLLPFTQSETLQLVRAVFGAVRYVERLAERFYRLSQGNASHCLELCEHLVRTDIASFVDGLWVLPSELSTADLPRTHAESILSRLRDLRPAVRALARVLSVASLGGLPKDVCLQIAGGEEKLAALVSAQVLWPSAMGFDFTDQGLRESLAAELSEEEQREAHRRIGEALLNVPQRDWLTRSNAGLHLLRAGELARGERLQAEVIDEIFEDPETEKFRRLTPLLERGFELLVAAGRDDYSLVRHLTFLGMSAYHVDRRHARYGDQAVRCQERVLKLPLALRLQRWLPNKLALIVALIVAGLGMAVRRSRTPSLPVTIRYMLYTISTLTGVAAICLDLRAGQRYARAIKPLAALGKQHVAGFVSDWADYFVLRSTDRLARTQARADEMIARLRIPGAIRGLPELARRNYLEGALFSKGVTATWQDTDEALRLADELSNGTPFYKMAADHLRAGYYGSQGNARETERSRQLVEKQAIQLGSAWQLEMWLPADNLKTAFLTHDRLATKRAVQELERLVEEVPTFSHYLRAARAAYLLQRGKPQEALPLLEQQDSAGAETIGWARSCGRLACAYNMLGEHEKARAVCEDAMARVDPGDLMFPAMNLNVQVELALAEAGLGRVDRAKTMLDQLIARHTPQHGPLTLGSLHDAYLQVALRDKDFALCDEQLAKLEDCYRPLALPSLLSRLELLTLQLRNARRGDQHGADVALLASDAQLITRVQLLLTQSGSQAAERARKGLQIAVELSAADDGFLVVQRQQDGVEAHLHAAPSTELANWARARLLAAYANDETAAVEDVGSLIDLNSMSADGVRYCVAPLWARVNHEDVVVAALALGFRNGTPKLPSADVLRVIASSLIGALSSSETSA